MLRAEPVRAMKGYEANTRNITAQAVAGGLSSAASALLAPIGIVGRGRIDVDPNAPGLAQKAYAQNLERGHFGVDEQTGAPLVGIDLAIADAQWDLGRLGAWVKHFRPDIYEQAHALKEQVRREAGTAATQPDQRPE